MKTTLLIASLFLCGFSVHAQNLVFNSSFEQNTGLPSSIAQWNLVVGWDNVNGGLAFPSPTPDYLHTAGSGSVGLPNSAFGTILPQDGEAVMGFAAWAEGTDGFREYLSTELIDPLVVGGVYELTFYITNGVEDISSAGGYGCANLGIHLSEGPLTQTDYFPITEIPQLTYTDMLYEQDWVQLSFTFTADAPYQRITIGNFNDDANTTLQQFVVTNTVGVYYFVDNFNLELVELEPVIEIEGPEVICEGEEAILVASGDIIIGWAEADDPTVIIETSETLTVMPTMTTTYNVYGMEDTASWTIEVIPNPVVDLGPDQNLCEGSSVLLDATFPGAVYTWQDGSSDPTFSVTETGTYFVTVDLNGCMASDTVFVEFGSLVVDVGPDQAICPGESVLLEASPEGASYLWQDGSTNPTFLADTPGTYWVEVEQGVCVNRDTVQVSLLEIPFIELDADTSFCTTDPVNYLLVPNAAPGLSYVWSDGSKDSTLLVTAPGTYIVTVSDGNCEASANATITQKECEVCEVYVPNVFTPDFNGLNDYFEVFPDCVPIGQRTRVFDRWGGLVFSSEEIGARWDGTAKGKSSDVGVYVYWVELTISDALGLRTLLLKGDVTLLR